MRNAEEGAEQLPESTGHVPEEAMLYCPVCDDRLIQRKCKLLCTRCGYYMSCADYY